MSLRVLKGTVAYLGKSTTEGRVSPGKSRFWVYEALKITSPQGKSETIDTVSILSTAAPEVQPGSEGAFIFTTGNKVKILVGIVKSDGIYNFTQRASEDSLKARTLGKIVMFFGFIPGLIIFPLGLFLMYKGWQFMRFPSISRMSDDELSAIASESLTRNYAGVL